jgi:PAS domain S-box-containing protein
MRKQTLSSLETLLEGTKSIAEGNLDTHIDLDGFEEFDKLANAYNEMTSELSRHIEEEQDLRKEAEENLSRWEALVEQAPNMILIHSEGEIHFINEAGVNIIGANSVEQVIGTQVFDYLHEAQQTRAIEQIQTLEQKREGVLPTVYRVQRLDGEYRYVHLQSVPITYHGKPASQTVGVDITDHVSYEEELQESLEEKSVLLQEIHHRVKNNLAVISGMMQLQAMESKNEGLTGKLYDSQLRIQSMASIHELLYDSKSFTDLNFSDQIKKLVATIGETLNTDTEVEINYQLEDVTLNVNQAIPAALIVNELVTNAFKHAFKEKEKGIINIILKANEQNLNLTIFDNGVGLPKDFDIHNASTLGMRIIQTLCQQLDATIQYKREDGSRFDIQFEMANIKGIGSAHLN